MEKDNKMNPANRPTGSGVPPRPGTPENPAQKSNPSTAPKPGQMPAFAQKKESNSGKGAGVAVVIFLAVLAILLAGGSALLLRQYLSARYEAEMNAKQVVLVEAEKQEILNQLDELEAMFAQLSLDNEQYEEALRAERRRVNQLRAQAGGVGSGASDEEVEALKTEIAALEAQIESYRNQITVLNSEKNQLSSENSQMRSTLVSTTSRNQELESKFDDMESKLKKAENLTISALEATALRERRRGDEPTDRARRADKISVCFTINQNHVAQAGNREFFVRLVDPNNSVLTTLPDNTFQFEGETLQYSLSRTVNFQNNSQDLCLFWTDDMKYEKGYYNVVVFTEGNEVGYKLFQLD